MERRGYQDQAFTIVFPESFKRQVFAYLQEYSNIREVNEKTVEAFIFFILRNYLEEAEVINTSDFWSRADDIVEEFIYTYKGR